MKQYTNSAQTAKLIELGLEKPKSKVLFEVGNDELGYAYSIGELIEILDNQDKLTLVKLEHRWHVNYHTKNIELIDALYDMLVKLKEEGVI